MKKANLLAPFPIYDTGDLKIFEDRIMNTSKDEEQVECCKACKNLFLIEDDFNNIWCGKCNMPTEIEILDNINKWGSKYGHIWTYYSLK